jgi:hypothetical protein
MFAVIERTHSVPLLCSLANAEKRQPGCRTPYRDPVQTSCLSKE